MENERVLIATDKMTLKAVLTEMFYQKSDSKPLPEFETDRLTKHQAAKLAGISIPTLDKQIKLGKFRQHEMGRKKYLIKSEMLTALRNTNL